MKNVTLEVSDLKTVGDRFIKAWKSGKPQGSHISFASVELMLRVLTERRWELLKAMTGQGPMSIREAARRVGRDVKAVHGDVHALLDSGVLHSTENGRIEFPFDAVHVDFKLRAA
ncbi:MAG: transcriptional regulator [Proteobacteria bacterium]|nr:transcriptional regulator [Pseudomonadota bacterium]